MDMLVRTELIMNAASFIDEINNKIYKDFPTAENGVNSLKGCWDGAAAEKAFGKFNEIKNMICEPRFQTMKNYSLFLRSAVCEGFDQTEEANKSLAAAFK